MTAAANDVAWELDPLLDGSSEGQLMDRAALVADELLDSHGTIALMDAGALAALMTGLAKMHELIGRATGYASLRHAANTLDEKLAATMQLLDERATAITAPLVFIELEWCAMPESRAAAILADERVALFRFHLSAQRRFTKHQLTEAEEKLDSEKAVSGRAAWVRLFGEQISAIECWLPDDDGTPTNVGLEHGLSTLQHHDRATRQRGHAALTSGLAEGIRTRAYIYNTLMLDRSIDDRLRGFPTWISNWNLRNHASDASVRALVASVRNRYDIAQRWYRLKARLLGFPLKDYDRYGAVIDEVEPVSWGEATLLVQDAYRAFSPELAGIVGTFFEDRWIDVPTRPGKRPGAFCSYTVPSHHPYLFLNWTNRANDVLTLAHELGHGVHGYLARGQGIFSQYTPLTVAETASVFGETLTFNRMLDQTTDPKARLALLAHQIEGGIATVFRQTAMHFFEDGVHHVRRNEGELSLERFGEIWAATQSEMLGDAVELTPEYRSWWSYIPHFIGTPGYVYAYAFGQLLALSVFGRYLEVGQPFVPRYLEMLAAGGSRSPEDLAAMVGCDLTDPSFWDGGLAIMSAQVDAAEAAAFPTSTH